MSVTVALLGALLASPIAAASAVPQLQADEVTLPAAAPPPGPPAAPSGLPVPIAALLRSPDLDEHTSRTIQGVVVRINAQLGATSDPPAPPALLLRDLAGDTISVLGADGRVALGEEVQVTGRLERDAAGTSRLIAEPRGLRVLHASGAPAAAMEPRPLRPGRPSPREWRYLGATTLGLSAVLLLLGSVALRKRWRSRDDAAIPLIVDLAALAPLEPASAHAAMAGRGAEPEVRQVAPRAELAAPAIEAPLRQVEPPHPREPDVVRAEPMVLHLAPAARPAAPALRYAEVETPGNGATDRVVTLPAAASVRSDPLPELGTDAPLQLLPGMLEIIEGADGPPQIRFFRTAALEVPELTLGRAHGPPYRHIHLRAPSVSRMHARLRFEGKGWKISNLSETNPLRVNDRVIAGVEAAHVLADGDEIHLGEVRLRYRES